VRPWIMWNVLTLDGLFDSEKNGALDWHQLVRDQERGRISLKQLIGRRRLGAGGVIRRYALEPDASEVPVKTP